MKVSYSLLLCLLGSTVFAKMSDDDFYSIYGFKKDKVPIYAKVLFQAAQEAFAQKPDPFSFVSDDQFDKRYCSYLSLETQYWCSFCSFYLNALKAHIAKKPLPLEKEEDVQTVKIFLRTCGFPMKRAMSDISKTLYFEQHTQLLQDVQLCEAIILQSLKRSDTLLESDSDIEDCVTHCSESDAL